MRQAGTHFVSSLRMYGSRFANYDLPPTNSLSGRFYDPFCHPSFHTSSAVEGVSVDSELLQDCQNCTRFQILVTPIGYHCSIPRGWIDPLSMRTSAPARNFKATKDSKSSRELSVVHPSAEIRDSNHTGLFSSFEIAVRGSFLPAS